MQKILYIVGLVVFEKAGHCEVVIHQFSVTQLSPVVYNAVSDLFVCHLLPSPK